MLDFHLKSIGEQILILHFLLLQYNSGEYLMNKLKQHIESNIKFLSEFNKKWFDSEAPFFKSLDLNWEDIENEVKQVKFNSNGIREEIEFKDGSMIQFLDDDDSIQSFYVSEKEYVELYSSISHLIEVFN